MSMSLEMQIDQELQKGESIYNLSTIVKGWNLSQNDSNAANTILKSYY